LGEGLDLWWDFGRDGDLKGLCAGELVLEGLLNGTTLASGDNGLLLRDQVVDDGLDGALEVGDLALDLDRVCESDGRSTVHGADTRLDGFRNILGGALKLRSIAAECLDSAVESSGSLLNLVYDTNDGLDLAFQNG